MGIKEFFTGSNKGVDCQDDEQGNKVCRVMIRHKNNKLSTGSEATFAMDNSCKAHIVGRYSVFDDDEEAMQRAKKKMESDCRGGIN